MKAMDLAVAPQKLVCLPIRATKGRVPSRGSKTPLVGSVGVEQLCCGLVGHSDSLTRELW
jgi:hypothetical protein